jgi:hypothetical protein
MKIRSDSPFAKLSKEVCDNLLIVSQTMTLEGMVKVGEGGPQPIRCSVGSMRKFLKRLAEERVLEESEEHTDVVEKLAKQAENPAVREATLETMRQRMFEAACESNNRELLMETFQALNAEKKEERAALVEERKLKILEENAKIGWRKLECENARAGLKALPRIREILMDTSKPVEERLAGALQFLGQMDVNVKLLPERMNAQADVAGPGPVAMPDLAPVSRQQDRVG